MADSLESVNIALSEEETMKLKGRIDRVDVCEDSENVYVKVIDYKSGNTAFDLVHCITDFSFSCVVFKMRQWNWNKELIRIKTYFRQGFLL